MGCVNFIAIVGLLSLASCTTQPDLPQYLAGADTIKIIFGDASKPDTLFIYSKEFVKKITHDLAYQTPALACPTCSNKLIFSRRSIKYTLLEGKLSDNKQTLYFVHAGKAYCCRVGKNAQTIITQAQKYPTLLKTGF